MGEDTYRKVIAKLKTMTPRKTDPASITAETEIYADLNIYGDDLFEFLIWIDKEFGTPIIVYGAKYAPSESAFLAITKAIRALCGRPRTYKSLTVRDIVQAIEADGGQFD